MEKKHYSLLAVHERQRLADIIGGKAYPAANNYSLGDHTSEAHIIHDLILMKAENAILQLKQENQKLALVPELEYALTDYLLLMTGRTSRLNTVVKQFFDSVIDEEKCSYHEYMTRIIEFARAKGGNAFNDDQPLFVNLIRNQKPIFNARYLTFFAMELNLAHDFARNIDQKKHYSMRTYHIVMLARNCNITTAGDLLNALLINSFGNHLTGDNSSFIEAIQNDAREFICDCIGQDNYRAIIEHDWNWQPF